MLDVKRLVLTGALLTTPIGQANSLPTPEEVQGIINACSAGRTAEVIGQVNLSFDKLFSGDLSGEGKISDLGGIIASIEDEKLKVEVYKLYITCIVPLLHKSTSDKDSENSSTSNGQSSSGNNSPNINFTNGSSGNIVINNK